MVSLTIEESTSEHIKFTLSDTTVSYANALRRVLISDVPTIAIDLVEIERNSTVLSDEMLTHRMGLIPIHSKRDLKYKEECNCLDFCDECSVVFEVDVLHIDDTPRIINTKDMRCNKEDFSVRGGPIIAKLAKNQGLKMKCIGRKGTGGMHSKWSPVSVVGFEYDKNNSKRETNYWFERSIEEEWPGITQEEADISGKIDTIHMCVEVIQGGASPLAVVLKALEILRKKVSDISSMIEAA